MAAKEGWATPIAGSGHGMLIAVIIALDPVHRSLASWLAAVERPLQPAAAQVWFDASISGIARQATLRPIAAIAQQSAARQQASPWPWDWSDCCCDPRTTTAAPTALLPWRLDPTSDAAPGRSPYGVAELNRRCVGPLGAGFSATASWGAPALERRNLHQPSPRKGAGAKQHCGSPSRPSSALCLWPLLKQTGR
jgi:hypothetical protein